ncbi:MAG: class IV adenylate cyclase [Gudongella sp.]|nr:class IV adenylate cyclase [Gudongella sp.]
MEKELEVKVLGVDINNIEEKIVKMGGVLIANEEQINTLIDSKNNPIKSYVDAYLRIRETKDNLTGSEKIELTLKKSIKNKELRENEELNVVLESKETMLDIFKNLGFTNVSVGFKHRKSYRFMDARIDLDTWDKETYPESYIEIELKDKKDLSVILDKLGINSKNISTLSIVELKEKLNNEA